MRDEILVLYILKSRVVKRFRSAVVAKIIVCKCHLYFLLLAVQPL